jgi:hypothetical protein
VTIVRHKDACGVPLGKDSAHLPPELFPQHFVECAEWLVKEHHIRTSCQCPCERDSLLFTSRQLVGIPASEMLKLHETEHLVDPLRTFRRRKVAQSKGNVLLDAQMTKESVVLKDETDTATLGRNVRDVSTTEEYGTCVERLEASNRAQQSGLSASAWPDQRDQLAWGNFEVDAVQHLSLTETSP